MRAAMTAGRTLGESRVHAYLLKGRGTIVTLDPKGLALRVTSPGDRPAVQIVTKPFVSGNAVRDASGLVYVGDFSDTMKFNQISFEINKLVVQEVIQPFLNDSPTAGQTLRFVGAAEVAEDATENQGFGEPLENTEKPSYHLLKVIPIRLTLD
jgi:predicted lipoprotein